MRIPIVGLVVSCLYVASSLANPVPVQGRTRKQSMRRTPTMYAACTSPRQSPVWTNSMKPDERNTCSSIATRKTHGRGTPFAIETGDNAGTYVTSSCGHAWKDFDEWEARMGKADTADGATI
jgi:hypothetical protein